MRRRYKRRIISGNIVAEETIKNGNCFFQCVARHIYGYALDDAELVSFISLIRYTIVQYVIDHKADFEEQLNCQNDFSDYNTYDDWVNNMSQNGIFADQTTVGAFIQCYGVNLHLWQQHSPGSEVTCVTFLTTLIGNREMTYGKNLNLLYITENTFKKIPGHYEYVDVANGVNYRCGQKIFNKTSVDSLKINDVVEQNEDVIMGNDDDVSMDTEKVDDRCRNTNIKTKRYHIDMLHDASASNILERWTVVAAGKRAPNKANKRKSAPHSEVKTSNQRRSESRKQARLHNSSTARSVPVSLFKKFDRVRHTKSNGWIRVGVITECRST
jgi:hypothetical protein